MIGALAREQWRAHSRSMVWLAVLLTVAVALVTFALASAAVQIRSEHDSRLLNGYGREYQAFFYSFSAGPPQDWEDDEWWGREMAVEELDALLARAVADGHDVWALRSGTMSLPLLQDRPTHEHFILATAYYPEMPLQESFLSRGRTPGPGEVAVSEELLALTGLDLGDMITMVPGFSGEGGATLTVVGGLRSPADPMSSYLPEAVVAWEDSISVLTDGLVDGESDTTAIITSASWNGLVGQLAPYGEPSFSWSLFSEEFSGPVSLAQRTSPAGGWALGFAGLVALGMLAAALTMGRALAQQRTQWTATVRVLGARKRTIGWATVLEVIVLGAISIALGVVLGHLIAQASLFFQHASTATPFLPTRVPVFGLVVGTAAAFGLALTVIVALIPAFWARRVAPVAALKATSPVAEGRVSRDVSGRWLVGLIAGFSVLGIASQAISERAESTARDVGTALALLSITVLLMLAIVSVIEMVRRLVPRAVARLGRSGHPWAVAAQTTLAAYPRQSTFPAAVMGLAVLVLTAVSMVFVINALSMFGGSADNFTTGVAITPSENFDGIPLGGVIVALLLAGLLAFAVTSTGRRMVKADLATQAALGLSRSDASRAVAVHQALPMAVGVLVGAVTGWLLPLAFQVAATSTAQHRSVSGLDLPVLAAGYGLWSAAIISVIALAVCALAGVAAALTVRDRSPVAELNAAR